MLHLFARILVANIYFYADNQLDPPHILTDAAYMLEQNSADVIGLFLLHEKDIIQNEVATGNTPANGRKAILSCIDDKTTMVLSCIILWKWLLKF